MINSTYIYGGFSGAAACPRLEPEAARDPLRRLGATATLRHQHTGGSSGSSFYTVPRHHFLTCCHLECRPMVRRSCCGRGPWSTMWWTWTCAERTHTTSPWDSPRRCRDTCVRATHQLKAKSLVCLWMINVDNLGRSLICGDVYALPCGMLCSGLCTHHPGRPLHLHGQRHHRHHSGQINNHTDNDQHCLLTPMPCVLCNAAVLPCQPYLRPSRRQSGPLPVA
jgi:hypothetical protein